ncbi:MAG: hypothetical protein HC836_30500 [Richelia sp. RM2_1_2]|nr:hypothetical protein [Richelia sp. RM2_1_2]
MNAPDSEQYHPYQQGEYLVICTYPRGKSLRCEYRSFDYHTARSKRDLENLAHDYSSFGLRIFHQGKLYHVTDSGKPGKISKQQDWKIHPDYKAAHYDRNTDGEIEICECSYPYFWALVLYLNLDNEASEKWQPVTCLVDDSDREIDNCPNCGSRLIEDDVEEDYDDFEPDYLLAACNGCSNYHGEFYNGNLLICAIHPHGFDNESCPDFAS